MATNLHNSTGTSAWVNFFHALGGEAPLPVAPFGTAKWYTFALFSAVAPSVVLALGLVIAVVVVSVLQRTRPVVMPSRRPTGCLLIIFSCLTLGVVWLTLCWSLEAGFMSYQAAAQQLPRAIDDLERLDSAIKDLNATIDNSLAQIQSLDKCCPSFDFTGSCLRAVHTFQRDPRLQEVQELTLLLQKMHMRLEPVTPALTEVEARSGYLDRYLAGTVIFTMVLVTAFVIFVVCAAELTVHLQGDIDQRINFCVLKSGSIPSCLIISFMALMAAVGLSVGIVMGNFCADPDRHSLEVVEFVANHTHDPEAVNQFGTYYITGRGSHPILDFKFESRLGDLTLLRIIDSLDSLVSSAVFRAILHLLGFGCPAISQADLPGVVALGKELIHMAHEVLSREHVYEYYQRVVLDGICTHVIAFQGWLVCARLVAALLCLPVIIFLAHDLLYQWAAFKEEELGGKGERPDSSDFSSLPEE